MVRESFNWGSPTGGFSKTISVSSGVPIVLNVSIPYIYTGLTVQISVTETGSTGSSTLLASRTLGMFSSHSISITPKTTSIKVTINTMSSLITAPFGGLFSIDYLGYEKVNYKPQTVLVNLCNDADDKYMFGFNTQENVNEIAGAGIHNTALFWEYDTRLGRRWNVDPLAADYPWNSTYAFAENRVIDGIDLEGKEFYYVHINEAPDGKRTLIEVINYTNVPRQNIANVPTGNIHTENGYGPQGDVGVNYTFTKVDNNGKVISRSGFNVKNLYGVYNGADNPKKYWESSNAKGEYPDDYSLPPIDEADLNGMIHDQDYDLLHLSGFYGVMDNKSTPANQAYRARAAKIVDKYQKGQTDAVTLKPVTKEAAQAAHIYAEEGVKSFKTAENVKKTLNNPPSPSVGIGPVRP